MPAKPLNKEGPKPAGFGRVFKRAAGPKGPAALGRLGKAAAAAAVGIELGNEKDHLVLRPNPRRRQATAPKVRGPLSWHLETAQIPNSLLRSTISKCEVDFLDLADGAPNQVIIRFMLLHQKKHDTDLVPAGTTGLKLSFEMDIGSTPSSSTVHPGFFNVELISYVGPHQKAARTCVLPAGPGRKTGHDFLGMLSDLDMIPCSFNRSGVDVVGSSDFMSQLLWHYAEEGLVEVPTTPSDSFLWPNFNLHHSLSSNGEPVDPMATRVQPAAFPKRYQRATITGVPLGTLSPVVKAGRKSGL